MIPDIPVTSVFLVLFLVLGVVHTKILKSNKSRGHKFIFNGALLGKSMLPYYSTYLW